MFHAARFAVLLLCLAVVPVGAAGDGAYLRPGQEEITPTYSRFMAGKRSLTLPAVDGLCGVLGLALASTGVAVDVAGEEGTPKNRGRRGKGTDSEQSGDTSKRNSKQPRPMTGGGSLS
jgi:hypothetical protein